MSRRRAPDVNALLQGLATGDRASLGRAITLVESQAARDAEPARQLLRAIADTSKQRPPSQRIGITGVPGVGKSSLIERLGLALVELGHRVAVIAVDPSSQRTGGSILGDKTRMPELTRHPQAFIRPSPAGRSLGGVARRTREVIQVCEAAGFGLVVVETVGVGQSEHLVSELVDVFVLLMLSGAGDELQGIKRGILELADLIVVQKADGERRAAALRAAQELRSVSDLMATPAFDWKLPVLTCSALTGEGVTELWQTIEAHRAHMQACGGWSARRSQQAKSQFETTLDELLQRAVAAHPRAKAELVAMRRAVAAGQIRTEAAAQRVLDCFLGPTEP